MPKGYIKGWQIQLDSLNIQNNSLCSLIFFNADFVTNGESIKIQVTDLFSIDLLHVLKINPLS